MIHWSFKSCLYSLSFPLLFISNSIVLQYKKLFHVFIFIKTCSGLKYDLFWWMFCELLQKYIFIYILQLLRMFSRCSLSSLDLCCNLTVFLNCWCWWWWVCGVCVCVCWCRWNLFWWKWNSEDTHIALLESCPFLWSSVYETEYIFLVDLFYTPLCISLIFWIILSSSLVW